VLNLLRSVKTCQATKLRPEPVSCSLSRISLAKATACSTCPSRGKVSATLTGPSPVPHPCHADCCGKNMENRLETSYGDKFFHCFFIPVFPLFGIYMFLSFASKMVLGPWEIATRSFFSNPFRFFSLFRFCIVLVIFPSFALKIVLGNYQRSFFSNPFLLFFVFVSCWLCFLPLP